MATASIEHDISISRSPPVFSVPYEVMSKIFILCLPQTYPFRFYRPLESPNDIKSHQAPLLLLHVCSEWRQIAISTHDLWVHLQLTVYPDRTYQGDLEEFISDWFSRAGSLPISFSIAEASLHGFTVDAVRTTLRRYASQLRSISLQMRFEFFQQTDFGPFPLLEQLAVDALARSDVESEEISGFDAFLRAPRLSKVLYGYLAAPTTVLVPYGGLTNLFCKWISGDHLLDVLSGTPLLVRLKCGTSHDQITRHSTPITLDRLECLQLDFPSNSIFLTLVRAPQIREVLLDGYVQAHHVPAFLAHCPRLRTLRSMTTIPTLAASSFSSLLSLTDLELEDPGTDFLHAFILMLDRSQHAGFLPQLRALRCSLLTVTRDHDFDDAQTSHFIQALSSRAVVPDAKSNTAVLQSFTINGRVRLAKFWDAACRQLSEQGMEISIGSRYPWKWEEWIL